MRAKTSNDEDDIDRIEEGDLVYMFGSLGPFRVVEHDLEEQDLTVCHEDEWQRNRGADLRGNGGAPYRVFSLEPGDDNSTGLHLRDGDSMRAVCGWRLVKTLDAHVGVEGVTDEPSRVTCEECTRIRSETLTRPVSTSGRISDGRMTGEEQIVARAIARYLETGIHVVEAHVAVEGKVLTLRRSGIRYGTQNSLVAGTTHGENEYEVIIRVRKIGDD